MTPGRRLPSAARSPRTAARAKVSAPWRPFSRIPSRTACEVLGLETAPRAPHGRCGSGRRGLEGWQAPADPVAAAVPGDLLHKIHQATCYIRYTIHLVYGPQPAHAARQLVWIGGQDRAAAAGCMCARRRGGALAGQHVLDAAGQASRYARHPRSRGARARRNIGTGRCTGVLHQGWHRPGRKGQDHGALPWAVYT